MMPNELINGISKLLQNGYNVSFREDHYLSIYANDTKIAYLYTDDYVSQWRFTHETQ